MISVVDVDILLMYAHGTVYPGMILEVRCLADRESPSPMASEVHFKG